MTRFQSWTVFIFMINIRFIFGTEDPTDPVKRPWLDLNLDPQDLPKPPEEFVNTSENDLIIGAECSEGGSACNYNRTLQTENESLFRNSRRIWDEVRSDPHMNNSKWRMLCKMTIKKLKEPITSLHNLACHPSSYIVTEKQNWRRITFKEVKERKKGCNFSQAPDLLLCECEYYPTNNYRNKEVERFAIKLYEKTKYFILLRQPSSYRSYYIVSDIYSLEIPSHATEKVTTG